MTRKRLVGVVTLFAVCGGLAFAWKFGFIQRVIGVGSYEVATFTGGGNDAEEAVTPVFEVRPDWTIRCEGRGAGFKWGVIREDKRDAGWLHTNKATNPNGGPDWSVDQTYFAGG